MQRRRFIKISALGTMATGVPFIQGCSSPFNKAIAQPFALSHIMDVKTITATGMAYRKQVPVEDNKAQLVLLLTARANIANSSAASEVCSLLDGKTRQDFMEAKTVITDGWILAQTEARQCALFSITQN